MNIVDQNGKLWKLSVLIDGCNFVLDYLGDKITFHPTTIDEMVDGWIFAKKDDDGVTHYTATENTCQLFSRLCEVWEKHPQFCQEEFETDEKYYRDHVTQSKK